MSEDSPIVAAEPRIYQIPVFRKRDNKTQSLILHSSSPKILRAIRKANTSIMQSDNLYKYTFTHGVKECKCPHVLIADDDAFQHLYYQNLFQRSLDLEGAELSKEMINLNLYFSGEELLKRYDSIKNCSCGKLLVAILDYHMGENKLNGIDVCLRMRRAGYKGPVLLRTSESMEFLKTQHRDLEWLLEENIITKIIEKSDNQHAKEVIEKFIKKES